MESDFSWNTVMDQAQDTHSKKYHTLLAEILVYILTLKKMNITLDNLHNQVQVTVQGKRQVTEQGTSYNQATSYIAGHLTHKTY